MKEFDSKLIPILREGVEIVKMALFKEIQNHVKKSYPDEESQFCNMLTGSVLNEIFSQPNHEEPFASFAIENSDNIKKIVLGFAGELDAAKAVQDSLPATSTVNGVSAFKSFPDNWANDWFPDAQYLFTFVDKKEEREGAQWARSWSDQKGFMTGRAFHYPPSFDGKDYCDWRDSGRTAEQFWDLVIRQLGGNA